MFCESGRLPAVQRSVKEDFGDALRELRLERELSQEELAGICGRHRTYVSLLERGQSSPSLDTVWLLADALDVSPSELVKRVEQRRSSRH